MRLLVLGWFVALGVAPLLAQTGLTMATTDGPYYVEGTGALVEGNLNGSSLPGTPVRISGKVYTGATGTKAVGKAKIELWQADAAGQYHPRGNGPAAQYAAGQLALRGFILSASDGSYSFTTIYPGYYEGRARHIHLRVTAEGHQTVSSQLILFPKEGDRVTYANDSIARSLPAYQLLKVNETTSPASATFDIRLAPR